MFVLRPGASSIGGSNNNFPWSCGLKAVLRLNFGFAITNYSLSTEAVSADNAGFQAIMLQAGAACELTLITLSGGRIWSDFDDFQRF